MGEERMANFALWLSPDYGEGKSEPRSRSTPFPI